MAGDKGGARFKPPKTREKLKSIEKFQPHLLVSTSDLCKWWTYCCEIVQDAQEHPLQDAAPYIWPFPKTPCPAKRVASGGMIRGMFRRYDSGVCFGVCFALPC